MAVSLRTALKASVAITVLCTLVWLAVVREPARTGILSDFDLSSGFYTLVFGTGEQALRSSYPHDPKVRVVDDQEMINRYRNEIDVSSGLTDFLPGEGRPQDIFLYVYRDGIRVAGTRVTQAERVKIPAPLLDASDVVPMRELVDNFDDGEWLGDHLRQSTGAQLGPS